MFYILERLLKEQVDLKSLQSMIRNHSLIGQKLFGHHELYSWYLNLLYSLEYGFLCVDSHELLDNSHNKLGVCGGLLPICTVNLSYERTQNFGRSSGCAPRGRKNYFDDALFAINECEWNRSKIGRSRAFCCRCNSHRKGPSEQNPGSISPFSRFHIRLYMRDTYPLAERSSM